jgi:hypothetical protein
MRPQGALFAQVKGVTLSTDSGTPSESAVLSMSLLPFYFFPDLKLLEILFLSYIVVIRVQPIEIKKHAI